MLVVNNNMFMDYVDNLYDLIKKAECTGSEGMQIFENIQATEKVIEFLVKCKTTDKKIIWIGNGGSAAIAAHSSIDYANTAQIKSICFTDASWLTCLSNDYGYQAVYERPVGLFAEPGDILVAISSSGMSENIINGVRAALAKECKVITLSGFQPDNVLRSLGTLNFYVPAQHYGLVELAHSVLCHCFLDLLIAKEKEEKQW